MPSRLVPRRSAVDPRPPPHRREHARGDPEQELDEHPRQGEGERARQARGHDVDHGLAHLVALAEIEVQRPSGRAARRPAARVRRSSESMRAARRGRAASRSARTGRAAGDRARAARGCARRRRGAPARPRPCAPGSPGSELLTANASDTTAHTTNEAPQEAGRGDSRAAPRRIAPSPSSLASRAPLGSRLSTAPRSSQTRVTSIGPDRVKRRKPRT